MIRNYIRIAWRNLAKHKVIACINLIGLTLGLTACLIIYFITSFELGYDTFHPDSDRIYRLVGEGKFGPNDELHQFGFLPNAVPKAIREEIPAIGTVAAFHNIESAVLIPNGKEKPKKFEHRNLGVKLVSKDRSLSEVKATLGRIEEQWKSVYPDSKFEYEFLDDSIAHLYEKEQKTSQIVNLATVISILISCMGLFGLVAFTAEQRTKEIGIRKVLGASVASIMVMLSKDFLKLVLIALIVASPLAWWGVAQWLNDFAYKINIDGWVFGLAGLLAILIALLTISAQSLKAALTNPVQSLRSE